MFSLSPLLSLTLFRVFDADLGRWLSRDPVPDAEFQQGPNLYAYVGDDPVNRVDPFGLACEKERITPEHSLIDVQQQLNWAYAQAAIAAAALGLTLYFTKGKALAVAMPAAEAGFASRRHTHRGRGPARPPGKGFR